MKLKPLDIVRTSFGTIAVVNEVSHSGSVSLVLPQGSSQKYAWYDREELVFVARTKDLVNSTPGLTQKKPKREVQKISPAINAIYEDMMGQQGRNQFGMN